MLVEPRGPQHGGGDRAGGTRRSSAAPDERDGRPAGGSPHRSRRARAAFRACARGGRARLATTPFGIEQPLVTLGVEASGPATEYGYLLPRDWQRRREIGGLRRLPAGRVRGEAAGRTRPRRLVGTPGVRLERGHVPVAAARRSAMRSSGTRPALTRGVAAGLGDGRPDGGVRGPAGALDRLRGDGARGAARHASSWRRWTSAGPTSAPGQRCSRSSARPGIEGGRGRGRASAIEARPDDLVVARDTTGRCRRSRGRRRYDHGRAQPTAVLRGARRARARRAGRCWTGAPQRRTRS